MSPKKYLWMDGQLRNTPDPDWNQEEAERRGLVKKAPILNFVSPSPSTSALKADADEYRRQTGQDADQIKPD